MTTTEKEIQIALGIYLQTMWEEVCKPFNKADEITREADQLINEGMDLLDDGSRFKDKIRCNSGCDLIEKGKRRKRDATRIRNESREIFVRAIKEVYGDHVDIMMWVDGVGCRLNNGMEFLR